MDAPTARRRVAAAPVARLASTRPDGAPHVVPVVFAADGETIYTAVDEKPKRTSRLQRLANLRHEPRCALLVDHYDHDWTRLWWARADGRATVIDEPPPDHSGLALLADKYDVYRTNPPRGALVIIAVERWTGWSAAST